MEASPRLKKRRRTGCARGRRSATTSTIIPWRAWIALWVAIGRTHISICAWRTRRHQPQARPQRTKVARITTFANGGIVLVLVRSWRTERASYRASLSCVAAWTAWRRCYRACATRGARRTRGAFSSATQARRIRVRARQARKCRRRAGQTEVTAFTLLAGGGTSRVLKFATIARSAYCLTWRRRFRARRTQSGHD